jgi:predicted ribonuclease YlaK
MFIEILVSLYADDTVIFSESKEGMQSALNIFQSKWKLTVNINKTKVLVLSKRKCQQNFDFTLNGENLDVIDPYIYLGITFKYNGSFLDARKRLVEHDQKSLFAIHKKIRNQNIPIDLQLKLLVELIILYGS